MCEKCLRQRIVGIRLGQYLVAVDAPGTVDILLQSLKSLLPLLHPGDISTLLIGTNVFEGELVGGHTEKC